jgi:subtilisin family serine protease
MQARLNFTAVAFAAAFASAATHAQTHYVLNVPAWGVAQQRAVAAADGKVVFASDEAGVAIVSSANPDFLAQARSNGAITGGVADRSMRSSEPPEEAPVTSIAVNPGDDLYFNSLQWAPQAVQAPDAWKMGFTGKGVRVAVIGSGTYERHVDLAANIDTAAGRSFVPPDPAASAADNACRTAYNCDTGTVWFATFAAGIIAGVDNSVGIVGIAPQATIIPVKAFHAGSADTANLIQAVLYASAPVAEGGGGADIIALTFTGTLSRREEGVAELIAAWNKVINTAARRGALVLAPAGDRALDMDHERDLIIVPAQSGNALAVSATGPVGYAYGAVNFSRLASYSNYGSSLVSVAAPGGDNAYPGNENCARPVPPLPPLVTQCRVFDRVISTVRGTSAAGGYTFGWGTYAATAAAAGVAALIKQKEPRISVGELKNRLMQSADDEGKPGVDPYYGRGFINAYRAVTF